MSKEVDMEVKSNSLENLQALRISSLEDEEELEEEEDDDDFDEEEDEEREPVTLGFVEKPKSSHSLLRHLFPSKAGGVPAWLDPVDLPSEKSCICGICGEPLQFLLQVYAPISEKESTFHRTLFVFMCVSMSCLLQDQHEQWKRRPENPSRSVKVFRCQMSRFNPFYSSEPPRHKGTDKPSGSEAALCNWCGTWKGGKVCSNCRKARYCSEKHQVLHWRSGHKTDCQRMSISSLSSVSSSTNSGTTSSEMHKVASSTLWPEFEIVSEDESAFDTEGSEDEYSQSLVAKDQMHETVKSLMDIFKGDGDKKSWASFQQCIAKAPDQVLRYCRDSKAKPLWPMSSGRPSKDDIPKCSYCNGPLVFEFQMLPQLLYYFGVKNDADSLDWATIAVYSCSDSCEASMSYKEEFAWVQLSSPSAMVEDKNMKQQWSLQQSIVAHQLLTLNIPGSFLKFLNTGKRITGGSDKSKNGDTGNISGVEDRRIVRKLSKAFQVSTGLQIGFLVKKPWLLEKVRSRDDEEGGNRELCKKRILMGERCRPLNL